MASDTATKKMREEATCSICQQLMTEPVSIDCGHSFCSSCITGLFPSKPWVFHRRTVACPLCQTQFARTSLRPNKQLQNLIETLKNMDLTNACEVHGEQLHLFCEDDGQLICWCCERSPQHKGHATLLVTEACKVYKRRMQQTVAMLKNLDEKCQRQMTITEQNKIECENKTEDQKQKIQSEFRNLQKFLREEEKSHLWRVERVKEKVLRRLQDNVASLQHQSQELRKQILELEEKCGASDQSLLQNVKGILNRSSAWRLELPEAVSLDLDMMRDASELYFDVKKILKSYQVNVTLDPETAHSALTVSNDHKTVTRGNHQLKSKTSTRFTAMNCVLGCEGFTSGRCYFEVDVRRATRCDLGVCLENVPRDVDMTMEPASGFWGIRLFKEKDCVALTSPATPTSQGKPGVMGVFLDWDAGLVSFYNMDTGSHIYTFPRASFSHTLRPFFRIFPDSFVFLPP